MNLLFVYVSFVCLLLLLEHVLWEKEIVIYVNNLGCIPVYLFGFNKVLYFNPGYHNGQLQ